MESVELREIKRLEHKFDEHILEDRAYMKDMRDELSRVWSAVGAKVSWTWFWTIMLVCGGVTSSVAFLLYDEIKMMRTEQQQFFEKQTEKQSAIQSDVSQIRGKLEPYKIQYKD